MAQADNNPVVTSFRDIPHQLRLRYVKNVNTDDEVNEIKSKQETIDLVKATGLDLVLINDKAEIPIYRLVDYNKFKYQQDRKAREERKKARENNRKLKEFLFSPAIEKHDFDTKIRQIRDALEKCDIMIFSMLNRKTRHMVPRGQTLAQFMNQEDSVLNRALEELEDVALPERRVNSDRRVQIYLTQKNNTRDK